MLAASDSKEAAGIAEDSGRFTREQIELQLGARERLEPRASGNAEAPAAPISPTAPAEPFGRWLLAQQDRRDWIDDLAAAGRADRGFPLAGSPDNVRARLQQLGADGDALEQVDDAERCWRSL